MTEKDFFICRFVTFYENGCFTCNSFNLFSITDKNFLNRLLPGEGTFFFYFSTEFPLATHYVGCSFISSTVTKLKSSGFR